VDLSPDWVKLNTLELTYVAFYGQSSFREEDFLEIDQSKTRIACGSHVC
jgi:hypothetical protein